MSRSSQRSEGSGSTSTGAFQAGCRGLPQYSNHSAQSSVGVRGVATVVGAAGYGTQYNDYRVESKTCLLPIIQIESAEAVKNVEEIAAVDGIGVLFVGPMDLSTSLGIFRQYDHPLFIDALNKTLTAAKKHNRAAGILLPGVETTRHYRDMGFRFITAGTDVLLLKTAASQLVQELRDA